MQCQGVPRLENKTKQNNFIIKKRFHLQKCMWELIHAEKISLNCLINLWISICIVIVPISPILTYKGDMAFKLMFTFFSNCFSNDTFNKGLNILHKHSMMPCSLKMFQDTAFFFLLNQQYRLRSLQQRAVLQVFHSQQALQTDLSGHAVVGHRPLNQTFHSLEIYFWTLYATSPFAS